MWKSAILRLGMYWAGFFAKRWGGAREKISLVTSRVRENANIELLERDIQKYEPTWDGRFDIVRAANVLNHAYFDDSRLEVMVQYLGKYLKVGGLFAVCRTDEFTAGERVEIDVLDPSRSLRADDVVRIVRIEAADGARNPLG